MLTEILHYRASYYRVSSSESAAVLKNNTRGQSFTTNAAKDFASPVSLAAVYARHELVTVIINAVA